MSLYQILFFGKLNEIMTFIYIYIYFRLKEDMLMKEMKMIDNKEKKKRKERIKEILELKNLM